MENVTFARGGEAAEGSQARVERGTRSLGCDAECAGVKEALLHQAVFFSICTP